MISPLSDASSSIGRETYEGTGTSDPHRRGNDCRNGETDRSSPLVKSATDLSRVCSSPCLLPFPFSYLTFRLPVLGSSLLHARRERDSQYCWLVRAIAARLLLNKSLRAFIFVRHGSAP
jgi:hypothetical protein